MMQYEDKEGNTLSNIIGPIPMSLGTYGFVLKFSRNTVANQIKQK